MKAEIDCYASKFETNHLRPIVGIGHPKLKVEPV